MRQMHLMFLLSQKVRGLFCGESIQYTWHDGATHFVWNFTGLGHETNIFIVFIDSKSQGPILRGIYPVNLTHWSNSFFFENLRGIGDETNVFGVFIVSKSQGPVLQGIYAVYSTWRSHSFCWKFQGPGSWDKHIQCSYCLRKSGASFTENLSSIHDMMVQLIFLKI